MKYFYYVVISGDGLSSTKAGFGCCSCPSGIFSVKELLKSWEKARGFPEGSSVLNFFTEVSEEFYIRFLEDYKDSTLVVGEDREEFTLG